LSIVSSPAPDGSPEKIEAVLTAVQSVARDTSIFTFERPDGGPMPGAEPGAHIGLLLPNGIERQYSLINSGSSLNQYVVGVKKDPKSRGGSSYMHDHLKTGTKLTLETPRNNFPLIESAEHVVLFAGGIGITPIYCMIRRLIEKNRSWELYYSARSRSDAAFLSDLEKYPQAHFHFDEETGGKVLPLPDIIPSLPKAAHLYCCGPTPMLAAFEATAETAGFPSAQVHVEYFTPKYAAAETGGYVVELAKTKKEFVIPDGKSILNVLRDSGIEVPSSCEEGICGACETKVISGTPDHRDAILSETERRENKTMFICCSGSKSPRLVLDL